MSGSLRRPYTAIPRAPGAYVAGLWVPAADGAPVGILASIQPASPADYDRLTVSEKGGRRVSGLLRIYTESRRLKVAGDEGYPGDIVIDDDGYNLLIIGEQNRHVLRTSVSHYKYFAVREIEHQPGERVL